MKWSTQSHLHLDRTASAWLIHRFVDPGAEFVFLPWGAEVDTGDPQLFGVPGATFSSHDGQGTCFVKILRAHGLTDDTALMRIEGAVAAGVRHALGRARPAEEAAEDTALGQSLDRIGVGLGVDHDDQAHLAAAKPLYDALHTAFRVEALGLKDLPPTMPERVALLRTALGTAGR